MSPVRFRLLVSLALLGVWLLPCAALSQEPDLAELAARERARRKASQREKGQGRNFGDDDLKEAAKEGATKPGKGSASAAKTSAGPAPEVIDTAAELKAQQASWQAKAKQIKDGIAGQDKRVLEIEARITELRNDLAPNPDDMLDPNRLQKRQDEMARLQVEQQACRTESERLKGALEQLQEQARREGLPSSWVED